jgi:hypothetical protein
VKEKRQVDSVDQGHGVIISSRNIVKIRWLLSHCHFKKEKKEATN